MHRGKLGLLLILLASMSTSDLWLAPIIPKRFQPKPPRLGWIEVRPGAFWKRWADDGMYITHLVDDQVNWYVFYKSQNDTCYSKLTAAFDEAERLMWLDAARQRIRCRCDEPDKKIGACGCPPFMAGNCCCIPENHP